MVNCGFGRCALSHCRSDPSSTTLRLQTDAVEFGVYLPTGLACPQCKVFASINTSHSARSRCVYVVGCDGQSFAYSSAVSLDVQFYNRCQKWSGSVLSNLLLALGIIESG